MPVIDGLLRLSILFALQVFKAGGGGADATGGGGREARADIFREFPGELLGGVYMWLASQCRACVIGDERQAGYNQAVRLRVVCRTWRWATSRCYRICG